MRASIAFTLLALAACGSSVETSPTGSSSSSGAGGAVTSSSSSSGAGGAATCSMEGGACAPTVQCVTPDVACKCVEGGLACQDVASGKPASLNAPPVVPSDGDCCDTEGMICAGYTECGPICTCTGGAWACPTPTACPPFACPTDPGELINLSMQPCGTEVGRVCSFGGGCTSISCSCDLDPETGAATWSCLSTPC